MQKIKWKSHNASYGNCRTKHLEKVLQHFAGKSNITETIRAWVGGISRVGDKYGASHWWTEPSGIYDIVEPDIGELLTNDVNKELFYKEVHTYQKVVNMCVHFWKNMDSKKKKSPPTNLKNATEK